MPTNNEETKETKKQTPKKTTSAKKTTTAKTTPKKTTTTKTSTPTKKTTTKTTTKKTTKKDETVKKQAPKTTAKTSTKKTTSAKKTTTAPKKEETKKETPKKENIKQEPKEEKKDFVEEAMNVVENIMDTKDTTNKYKEDDIAKNTAVSIIAYLGILSLIPYFLCKDSKFAMFNAKQGVNLFILEVICALLTNIIKLFTPWWIARAIIYVVYLIFVLLSLIGVINVLNGKAKELPYVSAFKFIK